MGMGLPVRMIGRVRVIALVRVGRAMGMVVRVHSVDGHFVQDIHRILIRGVCRWFENHYKILGIRSSLFIDHDIADFDLQRFGKVLQIQDETEHTGWAIIERRFHAKIAHPLPGWALHESVRPLTAGDTIPLRLDFE